MIHAAIMMLHIYAERDRCHLSGRVFECDVRDREETGLYSRDSSEDVRREWRPERSETEARIRCASFTACPCLTLRYLFTARAKIPEARAPQIQRYFAIPCQSCSLWAHHRCALCPLPLSHLLAHHTKRHTSTSSYGRTVNVHSHNAIYIMCSEPSGFSRLAVSHNSSQLGEASLGALGVGIRFWGSDDPMIRAVQVL
jgi:hypothetical protein